MKRFFRKKSDESEVLLGVLQGQEDSLVDTIEEWWLDRAAAGALNSPRGHAEDLAAWLRRVYA